MWRRKMDEKGRYALRFGEWYARISMPNRPLKNITEMIRSSETDRILSLYYGDEKYIHEQIYAYSGSFHYNHS